MNFAHLSSVPKQIAVLAIAAALPFAASSGTAQGGERIEKSANLNKIKIMRGSLTGGGWTITDPETGEVQPATHGIQRGGDFSCPAGTEVIVTHSASPFTGNNVPVIVQAGFEEGEIAAASYTIPGGQFPIQIDLIEVLVARPPGIAQVTTTTWSILVWSGNPNTGQLVGQFDSDGVVIPHIELGPEDGALIQASVDPTDPAQIVINDPGNQTFSIGFRINAHNVGGNPCLSPPPSDRNAFPTTDAGPGLPGDLSAPTQNWINAVSGPLCDLLCGIGWFTFQAFPAMCTPSGDWNIRASYCSASGAQIGACCLPDGSCLENIGDGTCGGLGGVFQGNGSTCPVGGCPVLIGACCDPVSGACSNGLLEGDCLAGGGTFQGEGTTCTANPCPEPMGACCLGGGSCLTSTESVCTGGGFTFAGNGTQCPDACQLGACCNPNDGSCSEEIEIDCTNGGGNFQGTGTTCVPNSCPQPTGACCNVGPQLTCFPDITEANCVGVGDWAGPLTVCTDCNACTTPGDLDGDGDVDLVDLGAFTLCFGPSVATGCECGDMDGSGSIDLSDWSAIEQLPVSGP